MKTPTLPVVTKEYRRKVERWGQLTLPEGEAMTAVMEREETRKAAGLAVRIARRDLHRIVQPAARVAAGRTSLAFLHNVLLDAGEAGLRAAATDLETSVELTTVAEVRGCGQACVDAKTFSAIVAALPEGDFDLLHDGKTLLLTSALAEYRLPTLPAEDFPVFPEVVGESRITLLAATLRDAIRQTELAASDDGTQPNLMSVLFQAEEDGLALVATDRKVLARRACAVEGELPGIVALIPASAVREVGKLLPDEGTADVVVTPNLVAFEAPGMRFTARLIAGEFPRYHRVIPSNHTSALVVDRECLEGAVRRLRLVAQNRDFPKVALSLGEGRVTLYSEGESGTAREELEAQVEGEPLEWAISANYIQPALAALDTEFVRLELTTPDKTGLLRPVDGPECLYALWPLTK